MTPIDFKDWNDQNISQLSARFRHLHKLPPANYLDKLLKKIYEDLVQVADFSQLILLDKLCFFLEKSYQKSNLIDRGYHCFEHNLEFSFLTLKLSGAKEPCYFHKADVIENFVAALLHDYDPRKTLTPPQVERTLWHLSHDEELKGMVERLPLNIGKVRLLIERTEYPFTPEKDLLWQSHLLSAFSDYKERLRFIERAERFAFADKSCTYILLSPEWAQKRVEGLAMELGKPAEEILEGTPAFFEREEIGSLAEWLPVKYKNRWNAVRGHFEDLKADIFLEKLSAPKE